MNKLIKKIQNFSHQYSLWKRDDKIIVGVSGGPDSVCLLNILAKLAPKYNFKLHIAHVNYGLRGKDSNQDEKFVRGLAEKYGIEVDVLDASALASSSPTPNPSPKGREGQISENALREVRYDFFKKIRKKKKYNLIAVAHNQDDQAETFLMRILRGAGLQGLRAMLPCTHLKLPLSAQGTAPAVGQGSASGGNPPLKKGESRVRSFSYNIIRPLLGTSREEIIKHLKENKLKYQTDITNKDTKIFRNKIRHKLIPYLEKNYNSNIREVLYKSSLSIAEDYNFITQAVENISHNVIPGSTRKLVDKSNLPCPDSRSPIAVEDKFRENDNPVIFSAEKFLKLHPAVQRQCLRQMISQARADLIDIETGHIEEIIKMIKSHKNKIQIIKFKGLKIEKKGDRVMIALT